MARTVKAPGQVRSDQGRTKRSGQDRSPAKEFNPSCEVKIVPKRTIDGREIWDAEIAPSAIQKLAKAAGVTEADLSWLNDDLKLMIYSLHAMSDRRPTWRQRIKHLRETLLEFSELEEKLHPEWVAEEMRLFEHRELRQQTFGVRGVVDLKTRADVQKFKEMERSASQLLEGVMRDVEAVTRMRLRLSNMIDQFGPGPPLPAAASNPAKQFIADIALNWWADMGHGEQRTKAFVAFC